MQQIFSSINTSLSTKSIESGHKYQRLISMVYITVLLAATVSAYKIVYFLLIPEPSSTIIFTSSYFIGALISELYGPQVAKRIVIESVICGFIFATLITIIDYLPSAMSYLNNSHAYHVVLGNTFRFTVSGTIGFILSSLINVHLVSKWRVLLNSRYFLIRSLGASIVGELVATFLAGILTFFGIMPLEKIIKLMFCAFLFKITYDIIAVFPVTAALIFLKKKEINIYKPNLSQKVL